MEEQEIDQVFTERDRINPEIKKQGGRADAVPPRFFNTTEL